MHSVYSTCLFHRGRCVYLIAESSVTGIAWVCTYVQGDQVAYLFRLAAVCKRMLVITHACIVTRVVWDCRTAGEGAGVCARISEPGRPEGQGGGAAARQGGGAPPGRGARQGAEGDPHVLANFLPVVLCLVVHYVLAHMWSVLCMSAIDSSTAQHAVLLSRNRGELHCLHSLSAAGVGAGRGDRARGGGAPEDCGG